MQHNPIQKFKIRICIQKSSVMISNNFLLSVTQLLIKYCDVAYVSKTVSLFLLFAVQHADLNFIQHYTQMTINNRPITFTAKNIIKACEIAVSKHEPKLSSFVFRCLLSFFTVTNSAEYVKVSIYIIHIERAHDLNFRYFGNTTQNN
jgi:hypothetical protein